MKTIHLTSRQRQDISDRRRHAQDRRIYQRLSAILWSDDGRTREEIAKLVGVSTRQLGQWFRIFRNKGLDGMARGDRKRFWENRLRSLVALISSYALLYGIFPRLINRFASRRGMFSRGCGFGRRFTARGS